MRFSTGHLADAGEGRRLFPLRTAFRSEGEQQSERSDAGVMIAQKVFGIVKRKRPERSEGLS